MAQSSAHRPITRTLSRLGAGVFTVATAIGLSAGVALADAMVVTAQGVDLKAGSSLKEDQTLALPAGATLQVIMPSGATVTLQGPYNGTIAGYSKSRGVSTGLENNRTRGVAPTR